MDKKLHLLPKIYTLLSIFSFFHIFSQSIKKDQCNGIFNDNDLLMKIVDEYEDRLNQPKNKEIIFGCGTGAKEYHEKLRCETATFILKKFPFILKELKAAEEKDEPLTIFWIDKKPEDLNKSEKDTIESWKAKKENNNHSAVIILSKLTTNHQILELQITTSKRSIVKQFQLFFDEKWNWKEI